MKYTFKPSIGMTLATLIVMAIFIKFGLWQYNKAAAKQALQKQLEISLQQPATGLPATPNDIETLRYKRVKFSGVYVPRYQVLLDNQVENTVVGYHVITPLALSGTQQVILVNRGWVAAVSNLQAPDIVTPTGEQQIEGDIAIPLAKFFTLEAPPPASNTWQPVWQNIDMKRYAKIVPFEIKPYIVRLNKTSVAGGYSRNWSSPGDRVATHLGYAYQWFGFALTLFFIYLVLNIKKVKKVIL